MKLKIIFSAFVFFFSSFSLTFASVYITEIMYAPSTAEGEWIELYNDDSMGVDVTKWVINDGSNHTISSGIVPAGGYLVVAANKSTFQSMYPSVSPAQVTALGLNDTGDTVILKNQNSVTVHSMSYTSSAGATKNGKSLQSISGIFYPGTPSPGKENDTTIATSTSNATSTANSTASTTPNTTSTATTTTQTEVVTYTSIYHPWPSDQNIYVSAGGDRLGVAGADIFFDGKLISADKKPLPAADLIWAFGDGATDRGRGVRHAFLYPGDYRVVLEAVWGEYLAQDIIVVKIIPPQISISRVENGDISFVELYNQTDKELDLSRWIIEMGGLGGQHFIIPKNTRIFPNSKIILPKEVTRLTLGLDNVNLRFPNNTIVAEYKKESVQEMPIEVKKETALVYENTTKAEITYTSKKAYTEYVKPITQTVNQTELVSAAEVQVEKETKDVMAATTSEGDVLIQSKAAATALTQKSFDFKNLKWYVLVILMLFSFVFVIWYGEYLESKNEKEEKESKSDEYEIIE
jgi:hypothetical protein